MTRSGPPSGDSDAERFRRRVDKMVAAGRVTGDEAEQLAAAGDDIERDDVVRAIRLRHLRARVEADVSSGRLTRQDADAMLERASNGEHPRHGTGRSTASDGLRP